MQNQQKNKDTKKRLGGLVFFVSILSVNLVRTLLQSGEAEVLLLPLLVVLAIAVPVGIFAIAAKKGLLKAGGTKAQLHSHDRLQNDNSAELCEDDGSTHWKKQLDGFLASGIIDRSEYNTLLKRHHED